MTPLVKARAAVERLRSEPAVLEEANIGCEKMLAAIIATGIPKEQAKAILAKGFAAKKGPKTTAGRGEARQAVAAEMKRLPNGNGHPRAKAKFSVPA